MCDLESPSKTDASYPGEGEKSFTVNDNSKKMMSGLSKTGSTATSHNVYMTPTSTEKGVNSQHF